MCAYDDCDQAVCPNIQIDSLVKSTQARRKVQTMNSFHRQFTEAISGKFHRDFTDESIEVR
jgi:hypothetical protein